MEKLFDGEYKLMEVLWEAGAVHSAQLVELCAQRLGWNQEHHLYRPPPPEKQGGGGPP